MTNRRGFEIQYPESALRVSCVVEVEVSSDGMDSLQTNKQRRIAEKKHNLNYPGTQVWAIKLTNPGMHCTALYEYCSLRLCTV